MRIDILTRSNEFPPLLKGSFLQSKAFFEILEKHSKAKPFMFICYDEQEREIAHLIVVRMRGFRIIPPGFHTWYNIYGEGAYNPDCTNREEIFSKFIDKLFDIFDFHHAFIKIDNIKDPRFAYKALSDREFIPLRSLRIYNSLHSRHPHERLTRAYRTHIRKSEERGVTYERATTRNDVEEGLNMLSSYYATKIRRNFPEKSTIRNLLYSSEGNDKAALFVIRHKGKIIGSSVCIYDGKQAYLAYSCGQRKRHPLLYPGIMAVWAAIKDAHDKGYEHFEFLEANKLPNIRSGYINSILNFGGKQASTLCWYHFKWKVLNKILRAIYV